MIIKKDFDLTGCNTFGIHAIAKQYIIIETPEDVLSARKMYGKPSYILGGGSNTLLSHQTYDTIRSIQLTSIKISSIESDGIDYPAIFSKDHTHLSVLTIGAGAIRHDVVLYSLRHTLRGIENLIAIPGHMGGAAVQNIGAYGRELQDVFVSCDVFDMETEQYITLTAKECQYSYRNSIFKQHPMRFCILSCTIALSHESLPCIQYDALRDYLETHTIVNPSQAQIAQTIETIRRSKLPHPETLGNAGSFFQNPVIHASLVRGLLHSYPTLPHFPVDHDHYKIPAARLIEHAGFKGYREGNVGSYEKQALVVVAYPGATGSDIISYTNSIIAAVHKKFGITITPEVVIL